MNICELNCYDMPKYHIHHRHHNCYHHYHQTDGMIFRDIWNKFLEFEANIGDLTSILKVEKRRTQTLGSVSVPAISILTHIYNAVLHVLHWLRCVFIIKNRIDLDLSDKIEPV